MNLEVTSLNSLQQYAQGQLVELPAFAEGQPFVARLRRPSMMVLAKTGKIPNTLLSTANALFNGDKKATMDPSALKEVMGIMEVICQASFVEPTYEQIQEVGLELTDEQFMAVFNYSQAGIRALDSFRQKQ